MSTLSATSRHDLSDAQWAVLEPLLPAAPKQGRPRSYPLRALIDGIRHRTRVGCPWRDVPERYGPWWRLYALFTAWQVLEVWERIESALLAAANAAGQLSWQVSVDSTTSRAHVHAAGARRDSPDLVAGEPEHHALGRSRGGFSTKTHLACDQHRGVLAFHLTPGQAGDSPEMTTVLEGIQVARPGHGRSRIRPDRVLADKAYSSGRTAPGWAGTESGPRSPPRPTRPGTGRTEAPPVDDHRPSTPRSTRTGTPSSAESTSSSTTAPSPPDTTNSPSASPPPSESPSSTTGSNDFHNRS